MPSSRALLGSSHGTTEHAAAWCIRAAGTSVSSPSSSPYTCCSRAELPPRLLPRHEVQLGRCSRSFSRAILAFSYDDTEQPALLHVRPTGANVEATSSSLSPRARRSLATQLDRRRRHMPDSDDVLAAAAILPHLERGETAQIARAAGCLDDRRPDHLGGVERRLSCQSAPTRRRAKSRDIGVQGATYRGQRTSRAARRAKDRPAGALSGLAGPPRQRPAGSATANIYMKSSPRHRVGLIFGGFHFG